MNCRRVIKGVLRNFLGTFTSRYSDYNGYWVFGFLVGEAAPMRIDLLDSSTTATTESPEAFTARLAAVKFAEQISKAKFQRTWLQEAKLEISISAESAFGLVNKQGSWGRNMSFLATATTDQGRSYQVTLSVFVAPHNPKVEQRSARAIAE